MYKLIVPFALISVILCGCTNNSKQDGASTPQSFSRNSDLSEIGINTTKIAGIDSLLNSFVENGKVNCVAAFVAKGGNVVYEKAFGWRDMENKIPASIDDYYVLFSQTKAVTTVAFMTLVEKGLVAIDDPVSKYFPEISDKVVTKVNEDGTYETRPTATPMTFVHLMSHSSGLGAGLVNEIRKAEAMKAAKEASTVEKENDTIPKGQRTFGARMRSKYLADEMKDLAKLAST